MAATRRTAGGIAQPISMFRSIIAASMPRFADYAVLPVAGMRPVDRVDTADRVETVDTWDTEDTVDDLRS